MDWAQLPTTTLAYRARRLTIVRDFAKYVVTMDPRTEVPPSGSFCRTLLYFLACADGQELRQY